MSKIVINELRQNANLLQTLAVAEADQVVGGLHISIALDSNLSSSGSSSASSRAFAYSTNTVGVTTEYGFSFKTRSENGVQIERKFEKFGNFPDDFAFPDF
jgi:hypothetical protein